MTRKMAIKLRKFSRVCPITGYNEESIKVGSFVIVQTDRGTEFGQIIDYPMGLPKRIARDVRLKKVLRYATDEDVRFEKELWGKENETFTTSIQRFRENNIRAKIVNVEFLFDMSKLIIYYRSNEGKTPPNFKDIKTELSREFKTKADLRQVSPRDEAQMFGGLGPCGRGLCCVSWLEKPKHVTVKMVKDQGLQISPTKTSGVCGRLMCCLQYESEEPGKKEGG